MPLLKSLDMLHTVVAQFDAATVALLAFLLGLSIHHLMIYGTLRAIRRDPRVYRIIKEEYIRTSRAQYALFSLFSGLAGVGFVLVFWFWSDRVPTWASVEFLLYAALTCFLLAGFFYEAGLARSAVSSVRRLLDQTIGKKS